MLFRAGFHSFALEMALNQAGIAFRKYGGLRYTEAAHVKDVIAFARLLLNPLDMPAFERLAALHEGIGPKTAQKLYEAAASGDAGRMAKAFARHAAFRADMEFIESLRACPQTPSLTLAAILEQYRPLLEQHYPEDWPRRQQALEELLQMAAGYTELDLFLADLALESPEEEEGGGEDRITLSTIHSAKGLEWNAVLIIDLVEDRFPSRHALARPEDFEEERRLMYVACTRARQQLDLYAPATLYSRAEQGMTHVNQSPFVREMGPQLAEQWLEGFGGGLRRRESGFGTPPETGSMSGSRPSALSRPAAGSFWGKERAPSPLADGGDDCQLPPEERLSAAPPAAPSAAVAATSSAATPAAAAHAGGPRLPQGYCRHRIFGRGKVVRQLPPDKVQVNFPGFGLKVILAEYLLMEDD